MMIGIGTILVMVATGVVTLLLPNVYMAKATLLKSDADWSTNTYPSPYCLTIRIEVSSMDSLDSVDFFNSRYVIVKQAQENQGEKMDKNEAER